MVGIVSIAKQIRRELRANTDAKYKRNNKKYYKKPTRSYGIRTPIVRKIAKKYFGRIEHLGKKEVFALSEEFFRSGYNEEAIMASQWVSQFTRQFRKNDFEIFEGWLRKYINNWWKDDDFCLRVIHPMIEKYPDLVDKVKLWSHSENMWLRRAAAVSFITTIDGFYATSHKLKDIFEVAEALLHDKEDLVQKGYGWMLKAASIHNRKEVFEFVMKHKRTMPRIALRYAIEKMPEDLKKRAMARGFIQPKNRTEKVLPRS